MSRSRRRDVGSADGTMLSLITISYCCIRAEEMSMRAAIDYIGVTASHANGMQKHQEGANLTKRDSRAEDTSRRRACFADMAVSAAGRTASSLSPVVARLRGLKRHRR